MKFLNNDKLINEARQLCAKLSTELYLKSIYDIHRSNKLEHLLINAYCRYQRRLNRCVLCTDENCSRDPTHIRKKICTGLLKSHFQN